jgi:hypothetical protein
MAGCSGSSPTAFDTSGYPEVSLDAIVGMTWPDALAHLKKTYGADVLLPNKTTVPSGGGEWPEWQRPLDLGNVRCPREGAVVREVLKPAEPGHNGEVLVECPALASPSSSVSALPQNTAGVPSEDVAKSVCNRKLASQMLTGWGEGQAEIQSTVTLDGAGYLAVTGGGTVVGVAGLWNMTCLVAGTDDAPVIAQFTADKVG